MLSRSWFILMMVALLESCGGGGESPTSSATSASGGTTGTSSKAPFDQSIEGLWQGTGASNLISYTVVSDSGALWLVYGSPEVLSTGAKAVSTWQGFSSVKGFIQGNVSASEGIIKGDVLREFTSTGESYDIGLHGTYTAAAALKATLTRPTAASVFEYKPSPIESYLYGATPRLVDIEGSWTGKEFINSYGADVNAAASIKLETEMAQKAGIGLKFGSCEISGEVVPRSSSVASENVFDVNLTAGDSCGVRSNRKYSGIALSQITASGKTQLTVLGISEDKTQGLVVAASK